MRLWTGLLVLSSIVGITGNQIKDSSSSLSLVDVDSGADGGHPPQIIDPWAKRYLKALSSAGDLSSYYQDDSVKDFVFPARFKRHHSHRNLCHGKLMADVPDKDGKLSPLPPRSFYGWDQDYCEWLTAVSFAKITPAQRAAYVKDPTLYYYSVPDDNALFLYTESRHTLEHTITENLSKLPPNRAENWKKVGPQWENKPSAVKLVNQVCEMMEESQGLWPSKFHGTINRIPLSGGLLIAMAEMGARMELSDDTDPNMTDANRLHKVAAFYKRYADENAQTKMAAWINALNNNTRADDWVSNGQLEITLCKSPLSSVGSMKIKSYASSNYDIKTIYPDTCSKLWNKESSSTYDEPVILDYGAAMRMGPYCGKNGTDWCRPALFGITTEQFPAVTLRVRQHNMRKLFSLKRRGRGPITAEYNALIDKLISFLAIPDWLNDEQVVEIRIIAKRVLDILENKPDPTDAPTTPSPTTSSCCCCSTCSTCCGNPIAKLKESVLKQAIKFFKKNQQTTPDVDTDANEGIEKGPILDKLAKGGKQVMNFLKKKQQTEQTEEENEE